VEEVMNYKNEAKERVRKSLKEVMKAKNEACSHIKLLPACITHYAYELSR
jgi:hypothetical protein